MLIVDVENEFNNRLEYGKEVLKDLKMDKLRAENLGQMNLYLNYDEQVINSKDAGKLIGIILCAEKR